MKDLAKKVLLAYLLAADKDLREACMIAAGVGSPVLDATLIYAILDGDGGLAWARDTERGYGQFHREIRGEDLTVRSCEIFMIQHRDSPGEYWDFAEDDWGMNAIHVSDVELEGIKKTYAKHPEFKNWKIVSCGVADLSFGE